MSVRQHDCPKLYLDEHLSPRIAAQLRKYGFDVITLHERGMLSEDDDEQLAAAVSEQRAVVTCNFRDYVALGEEYAAGGMQHWGIILTTEEPTGVLIKRLLKLLNSLSANELKNHMRWLNEFR
jgi:predicted nuclease of predicted toxin-antitoxin system